MNRDVLIHRNWKPKSPETAFKYLNTDRPVTGNDGQVGAVDRNGPAPGLPRAFSGHNGYANWGHPPDDVPVLVVGIDPPLLRQAREELEPSGRLVNAFAIDDENGTMMFYCVPHRPGQELWPQFVHMG